MLLLCSWGYIYKWLRFPGEVRVTPPIGVVSVTPQKYPRIFIIILLYILGMN